jgi:signal transduction protein with GAF and PtsI domain
MSSAPQRRFDLKEFKAISRAISTYEDLTILMDHMVEGMARAFKVKGASIMLYDETEGQLFRVASYGLSETYLKKGPLLLGEQDDAFVKGEPSFVPDMQNDPRIQYPEAAWAENIRSMYSFPVKSRKAVVGLLRIYHGETFALHPDDLDSISVMSLLLGLVIEENGLRNFLQTVSGAIANLPPRMRQGG